MKIESAHKLAEALFGDDSGEEPFDLPIIEGYALIQEIGRGGAGVVYEGVVKSTGRRVAVKILHSCNTRPAAHVLHELDRLASVRSQVVPHVFEHGSSDGRMYIVTEFIDGVNPIEFVEGLDFRDRVELLAKISDAVGTLNSRGIIHRDIKPSNILVTADGAPVIIDLGISMLTDCDSDTDLYMNTKVTGTIAYMPPEQARGENIEVSIRWDVYGLGAVGYQLLTGSTPYKLEGTSRENLAIIQTTPPQDPRAISPNLPKPLGFILAKACAFDADDRYETAQLLRDDFRRWLNGEPVLAGPQSKWMRMMRLITRHPIYSVAVACLLIFVLSVLSTAWFVWWQNIQPYRFADANSEFVSITSIQSRSGRELHTWQTKSEYGVVYTGSIVETNGERYAIVGLGSSDIESGHRGLVGYVLGEFDRPAWVARPDVPDGLRYAVRFEPPPHDFTLMRLIVEDVFPEHDGFEIVSLHRHRPYSVCAIQIHSASGKLLGEYYHDGWIDSIYWNPISRQLVAVGQNSDGNWFARGFDQIWVSNYPVVAFAFKPQVGEFQQVIRHPDLSAGLEPDWYQFLSPPSAYWAISDGQVVGVVAKQPYSSQHQELGYSEIQLSIGSDGRGCVYLIVDQQGAVIDVRATDTWSRMHEGLDPNIFQFIDLPARTEPRQYEP